MDIIPEPVHASSEVILDRTNKNKGKGLILLTLSLFIIFIVLLTGYLLFRNLNQPILQDVIIDNEPNDNSTNSNSNNSDKINDTNSSAKDSTEEIKSKTISFTVTGENLKRPAKGATQFTFTVPIETQLVKNVNDSPNITNPGLNFTLNGSNWSINISQPYETFPLSFDSTLTGLGEINEIGKIWRYKMQNGNYNYTSRVNETIDCQLLDGSKVNPPCGEPGIKFKDEDLASYFVITCDSTNVSVCDDIVKSVEINAVPASACANDSCV